MSQIHKFYLTEFLKTQRHFIPIMILFLHLHGHAYHRHTALSEPNFFPDPRLQKRSERMIGFFSQVFAGILDFRNARISVLPEI